MKYGLYSEIAKLPSRKALKIFSHLESKLKNELILKNIVVRTLTEFLSFVTNMKLVRITTLFNLYKKYFYQA